MGRDRFPLTLRRLSVQVPYDLAVRPVGNLTIHHQSGDQKTTVTLEPFGEPRDDPQNRLRTYSFRAPEGGALVYRPGDKLWAELPVRKEGESGPWAFTWVRGRSQMYQFEHLVRGVYLHPVDQPPGSGRYYEDLGLQPGPETQIPSVPDLMPIVRLE